MSASNLLGLGHLRPVDGAHVNPIHFEPVAKAPLINAGPSSNVGTRVWNELQHRAPASVLQSSKASPASILETAKRVAAAPAFSGAAPLQIIQAVHGIKTFAQREFKTVQGQTFTGAQLLSNAVIQGTTEAGRHMVRDLGLGWGLPTESSGGLRSGMALFPRNDELPYFALGALGTLMGGQTLKGPATHFHFKLERRTPTPRPAIKSVESAPGLRTHIQEIAELQSAIRKGKESYSAILLRADDASTHLLAVEAKLKKAESEYRAWDARSGKSVPVSSAKTDARQALQQLKENYLSAKKKHGQLMEEATQLLVRLETLNRRHEQLQGAGLKKTRS